MIPKMPDPGPKSTTAPRFPRLYPILDADMVLRGSSTTPSTRHDILERIVRELAGAGVEILQYRNKSGSDSAVLEDAHVIREAAGPMRLILNDRASLLAATRWDGVHLGQEDLSPSQARWLVGPRAILGLSTHSEEQVVAANKEPVDYIAIGPIFSTTTKHDTSPVVGLEGVRRVRALTAKPLVAIGGITLETAVSVYAAGADSLAVISAIFGAGQDSSRTAAQRARDFLEIFK